MRGGAVALTSVLLLLVFLELAASAWGNWRRARSLGSPEGPLVIVSDPELGWRSAPNRDLAAAVADAQDSRAAGRFTTDDRGWRRYDSTKQRPLALVLGDSFTHGQHVADGLLYYDVIAERVGLDVVALAVNGYGTVQQLMVAREEKERLPQPDLLLLQMSDNDVVNNSWELERRSWLNNNLMPRPYLEESGEINVRDPRRWFEHTTLGRQLTRRILSRRLPSIEPRIQAGEAAAVELYRRELGATAQALQALRELFSEVPAYAFNVGGSDSVVARDLARLGAEAGFRVLDLGAIGLQDRVVLPDGVHWNARGHRIAGERLTTQLTLDHR